MNAKAHPGVAAAEADECKGGSHPLEIFPIFRGGTPSLARSLAYTFLWNGLVGLLFWFIAIATSPRSNFNSEYFIWNLLTANAIGYTMHALFAVGNLAGIETWARRTNPIAKVLYYTLVSSIGVVIGFALVSLLVGEGTFRNWLRSPGWVAAMTFVSLLVSIILSMIFFWRERHARDEAELQRQRLRAERVEREAVLANLRALQAQIEPHFLFNTLANVSSLVDADPARAKGMLESFIRFLRASLAATRRESTTLAEEGELIGAYLDVLQVRMGARLRYRIEVDPSLAAFALPPMLLQPLVENAIRHGLEPKMDGGEVAFRARPDGARVAIEIADTGIGFATVTRGGVGLENIRARLKLLYGDGASLSIAENPPAGTIVTLRIPR